MDVSIRLGTGNGNFTSIDTDVGVGNSPNSVAVGFFNADSFLDLAVSNFFGDVSIRLGNGDGTFNSTAPVVGVGNNPDFVSVGFFNADSFLDLAVVNSGDADVSIRLGNGDGTFNSTAPDVVVGVQPTSSAVGFFNADSFLDLAVVNSGSFFRIVLSLSALETVMVTFNSTAPDVGVGTFPIYVSVGFFNADSFLDFAVDNVNQDVVSIRLGNGDGIFKFNST